MRALKLSLPLLVLLPMILGLAGPATEPCAPINPPTHPLHIAWIFCQDNDDEIVVIFNATNQEWNLEGWKLDSLGGQKFRFQSNSGNPGCCMLEPYGTFRIHSGKRNLEDFTDSSDLHWLNADGTRREAQVWRDSHDIATLWNNKGDIFAIYEYGHE